jgi:hypothetical protein
MDVCREAQPRMFEVSEGHYVSCHLFDEEGEGDE